MAVTIESAVVITSLHRNIQLSMENINILYVKHRMYRVDPTKHLPSPRQRRNAKEPMQSNNTV
jgi:hypothetical protein